MTAWRCELTRILQIRNSWGRLTVGKILDGAEGPTVGVEHLGSAYVLCRATANLAEVSGPASQASPCATTSDVGLFAGDGVPSERLAYIERIAKFTTPNSDHQMFKLKRSVENGEQVASIVPVSTIRRSAHLLLKFGSAVPEGWSSDNVLEECASFYLNPFADRHMYFVL